MNYIYDVVLNLNKNNIYEFYEWKDEDNPEFILKIPMYKVDKDTFLNIKYDDIIINKKFLDVIEDKTETYSPNSISIIRYACIFVCDENVIAVEFDSDGNNYMKSNLSIEEQQEIIDASKSIKYSIIEYKIKKQSKGDKKYVTRKEEEIEKNLILKLNNMKKNNEISKLKYIFYEIYNEKLDDVDKIYNKLINVALAYNQKTMKLLEILNLTENKKIMSNNS